MRRLCRIDLNKAKAQMFLAASSAAELFGPAKAFGSVSGFAATVRIENSTSVACYNQYLKYF